MAISDSDYNQAREILIRAGSQTAKASHPKHTAGKGSPIVHGQQLLRAARDEFRKADQDKPNLRSEMTQAHYEAIHKAARKMGIKDW